MTTPRRALDLSAYQGVPGFAQLRVDGIEVVIIKLTEGVDGTDARGLANVAAARAAGLRVLPYHFLRAGSPEQQAFHFRSIRQLAGLASERPCIDFEDGASVPTATDLLVFARALSDAGPRRPIVYVSPDKAARANLAAMPEIAALADLWLARWAATPGAVPAPWRAAQLVLWQRGLGQEHGVGRVDEDLVVGDLDGDLKDEGPGETRSPEPLPAPVAGPSLVAPGAESLPRPRQSGEDAPAAPAAQEPDPEIDVSDTADTWDDATPVTHGEAGT